MTTPLLACLATSDVQPDPNQPRRRFDDEAQRALVESIRHCGVLQSVRVRRTSDRWVIIDGERRWRAAMELGLETIPVVVEEREVDDAGVLAQQLAANLARSDLDPIEKADAIRRAMELGDHTMADMARAVGISEASASKHLALLRLPESEQQRVRDGSLGFVAAYRLARRGDQASKPAFRRPAAILRRNPTVRRPLRLRIDRGVALVLGRGTHTPGSLADVLATLVARLRSPQFQDATLEDFLKLCDC